MSYDFIFDSTQILKEISSLPTSGTSVVLFTLPTPLLLYPLKDNQKGEKNYFDSNRSRTALFQKILAVQVFSGWILALLQSTIPLSIQILASRRVVLSL